MQATDRRHGLNAVDVHVCMAGGSGAVLPAHGRWTGHAAWAWHGHGMRLPEHGRTATTCSRPWQQHVAPSNCSAWPPRACAAHGMPAAGRLPTRPHSHKVVAGLQRGREEAEGSSVRARHNHKSSPGHGAWAAGGMRAWATAHVPASCTHASCPLNAGCALLLCQQQHHLKLVLHASTVSSSSRRRTTHQQFN